MTDATNGLLGFDPKETFQDGLSHPELLAVTGLTTGRLMEWYKRRLMPVGFSLSPGRGNKRRYSLNDARTLTVMRELTDAGIPVKDARELAPRFALFLSVVADVALLGANTLQGAIEHGDKLVSPILIVRRNPNMCVEDVRFFHTDSFVAVNLERSDTIETLQKWIREVKSTSVIWLDMVQIAFHQIANLRRIYRERAATK